MDIHSYTSIDGSQASSQKKNEAFFGEKTNPVQIRGYGCKGKCFS